MDDYTGLAAIAWDLFSGDTPGPDDPYFRSLIAGDPGPVLDVGCGTGRLLLSYLAAGLDVEGVDRNEDMLALCRRKATEGGLEPVLYPQPMQALDLPRRYRTILIPCGSLQLVTDRREVFESLRRFHVHLEPGGLLIVTTYAPGKGICAEVPTPWGFRARQALPDGTEIDKHARIERRDLMEQTMEVTVRYRRFRGEARIEEQMCQAPERWFFRHELAMMLESTGFGDVRVTGNYEDREATEEDYVWVFTARKE